MDIFGKSTNTRKDTFQQLMSYLTTKMVNPKNKIDSFEKSEMFENNWIYSNVKFYGQSRRANKTR